MPLSSGGPYFGFMTTRMEYVRQMPGRIVGRTLDVDGRAGFTLTLQAREQHIRRAKATSNICTNQGLLVTAATIYLSLMGPQGLARTAAACHARTRELVTALTRVPGVRAGLQRRRTSTRRCCSSTGRWRRCCKALAARGILGGLDLSGYYPELGAALLVCATETKTTADIERYRAALHGGDAGGARGLIAQDPPQPWLPREKVIFEYSHARTRRERPVAARRRRRRRSPTCRAALRRAAAAAAARGRASWRRCATSRACRS